MKLSWKGNFFALLAAETLAIVGFALCMPIMPLFLSADIGITDPQELKTWTGLVQSAAAVSLFIFSPIWGHLADLTSRRLMLLRAMFAGAVFVSLLALTDAPWQILTLRFIQGMLTGTVAAATVLVAGISPTAQLALTLGMLQTGIAVGNTIGPLFGGVMGDFIGFRMVFLCSGLCLAVAGVLVFFFVQDDKRPPKDPAAPKPKFRLLPDFSVVLHNPLILTLLFVSFTVQAANTILAPMLPLFLQSLDAHAGHIGSATGVVIGVGAMATAIASVAVGKYALAIGYWKVLIGCLGIAALFTIPQSFVENAFQLAALRFCSSFFVGGSIPVLNAILASHTPKENQGSVYGINSSLGSAGGAIGPMIGSALAMWSFHAVFFGTAILLFLASAGTWYRARTRKLK
jgi:DHA1 family multidrug resistance protein-like MFS transporter